ncbi:hypothetical protein KQX54_005923 [Cotesia glomerata]|uniref:Uncharacterized protein n=1 Tax=Cotesia glomerata TaxID=32391 RepID=A0AAV7IM68_COTGL|nr:hypothetical protein KQX54_005923 [Cotesia glomerata]
MRVVGSPTLYKTRSRRSSCLEYTMQSSDMCPRYEEGAIMIPCWQRCRFIRPCFLIPAINVPKMIFQKHPPDGSYLVVGFHLGQTHLYVLKFVAFAYMVPLLVKQPGSRLMWA